MARRQWQMPFGNLNNQDFNSLTGANRGRRLGQQRRSTRNQARTLVDRWTIEEVPFDEPSAYFTHRLEVSFNTSYIVPSAPQRTPPPGVSARDWDPFIEFDPLVDSLFPTRPGNPHYALRPFFQELRPARLRIYFLHPDGSIQILEDGSPRQWGGATFVNDNAGMKALRESFASTLAAFVDEYQDEDIANGDMQYVRMYVDIEPAIGGAGLPKTLPSNIPPGVIWEPRGFGNCAFKCLAQAVRFDNRGMTWNAMRQKLSPYQDNCDSIQLLKKFVEEFPKFSVRLLSVTGYLRAREDGAQFHYAPDDLRHPGGHSRQPYCVYLLLEDGHYYLIQLVLQFIRSIRELPEAQYCHGCCLIFRATADWQTHVCTDDRVCQRCQMFFNVSWQKQAHENHNALEMDYNACEYCGQANFFSEECFTHHQLHCPARHVASRLQLFRDHNQRSPTCNRCAKKFPPGTEHICYMEASDLPEENKYDEMYAFDFECLLIPHHASSFLHRINYVGVQQIGNPDAKWAFETCEAFIQWIYDHLFVREDLKFALYAHNLKGYDGRLLLCEIYKAQRERDAEHVKGMIWTGAKINTFKWRQVSFCDSLLHIAFPLAKFPEVFGLESMEKGHFPYLFNTPENQNYVGPIPDIHYFEPQFKPPKERKELLEWHAREVARGEVYDFKRILHDYCMSDVDILARALEKYNAAGQELNHVQLPPLERLTIASYTLNCWRTLHFPEQTIVNHSQLESQRARAALRGGRTDVRCFYRKWSMEDVFVRGCYGKYVDVVSMYPYVMYTFPMPVGKPVTVEEAQASAELIMTPDLLGFAEVDIDPPFTYTHHPAAVHSHESGRLVGQLKRWSRKVFCLTELRDMLNDGWILIHIYWIQHYDSNADMFKEYISKLVREKTQASKNPAYYDRTHQEWAQRFGVHLERDKMARNDGLRSIAKLQLNSLWGKLAERVKHDFSFNVDQEEFLHYENLEILGHIKFKHKLRVGPNSWLLTGQRISVPTYTKPDTLNRCNTSVAIGAHVTMWGRRMLTTEMKKLGKRTLYHDTDSIIYAYDPSADYNTPTGEFLGEWEEELPGCAMIEFVALAPKTYAYRYIDMSKGIPIPQDAPIEFFTQYPHYEIWQQKLYVVHEKIKVKGIKLHYDALQQINFNGLLDLYRGAKNTLQATQLSLKYDRDLHQITTKHFQKDLIFQYEKGLKGLGDDNCSYPFGADNYWIDGVVEEGARIRRRARASDDIS